MRKLVSLVLAATALAAPSLAMADTTRGELRRDRADVREERGEYRQALRHGSPRDVREEREEYRDSIRELREDRRDWRDDRHDDHRDRWSDRSARWDAPFAYRGYRAGWRADRSHYGSRYIINRPWALGLPAARGPFQWVRHYGDALLVDMRSGHVRRVVPGVFRRTR